MVVVSSGQQLRFVDLVCVNETPDPCYFVPDLGKVNAGGENLDNNLSREIKDLIPDSEA